MRYIIYDCIGESLQTIQEEKWVRMEFDSLPEAEEYLQGLCQAGECSRDYYIVEISE
jgi:hypothetical protein